MTSSSAQVDTSPERPATVPTLQDRAGQLAPLGWTGREAEWLALVALHSGAFTRAQCGVYFQAGDDRKRLLRFVRALIEKQLAIEDARPIFPGGARAVLLTGKPIYQALGIPDVRHRRSKAATTIVLMRRLLSLDYIIARPTLGWLPTEGDKVQRFEALGLDRRTFPYRLSGPSGTPQTPRYFAFKLPIAVDDQAATFVYVDPGQTTDSELRAWGVAPRAPVGRTSGADVRRAGRRGWRGRRRGRPRRAPAQTLDPGRRRHGHRQPYRADPGRPGHSSGNRSLERCDYRRRSHRACRARWIQNSRSIGSKHCGNFPKARPPQRRRGWRLTASRFGQPRG